jgi:hypothetical protein
MKKLLGTVMLCLFATSIVAQAAPHAKHKAAHHKAARAHHKQVAHKGAAHRRANHKNA